MSISGATLQYASKCERINEAQGHDLSLTPAADQKTSKSSQTCALIQVLSKTGATPQYACIACTGRRGFRRPCRSHYSDPTSPLLFCNVLSRKLPRPANKVTPRTQMSSFHSECTYCLHREVRMTTAPTITGSDPAVRQQTCTIPGSAKPPTPSYSSSRPNEEAEFAQTCANEPCSCQIRSDPAVRQHTVHWARKLRGRPCCSKHPGPTPPLLPCNVLSRK